MTLTAWPRTATHPQLDSKSKRRLLVCVLGCLALLVIDQPARMRLLTCPAAVAAAEADPPPPPPPKEEKAPSGFAPRGKTAVEEVVEEEAEPPLTMEQVRQLARLARLVGFVVCRGGSFRGTDDWCALP